MPFAAPSLPELPSQHAQAWALPNSIPFSTFVHHILPFLPEIQFGEHKDGPPRWTSWLESRYHAYDPQVWTMLAEDDAADEQVRWEGGVAQETVKKFEEKYVWLSLSRLWRRESIYGPSLVSLFFFSRLTSFVAGLHLVRERFLAFHRPQHPKLRDHEIVSHLCNAALADTGDAKLICPHPPGTSTLVSYET
jgi:hypothetical protein